MSGLHSGTPTGAVKTIITLIIIHPPVPPTPTSCFCGHALGWEMMMVMVSEDNGEENDNNGG